jgi:hypothetical protein
MFRFNRPGRRKGTKVIKFPTPNVKQLECQLNWYRNRESDCSPQEQDDRLEALETTASWGDYEMSWHEVKPEPEPRPKVRVYERYDPEPDWVKNWGLRY